MALSPSHSNLGAIRSVLSLLHDVPASALALPADGEPLSGGILCIGPDVEPRLALVHSCWQRISLASCFSRSRLDSFGGRTPVLMEGPDCLMLSATSLSSPTPWMLSSACSRDYMMRPATSLSPPTPREESTACSRDCMIRLAKFFVTSGSRMSSSRAAPTPPSVASASASNSSLTPSKQDNTASCHRCSSGNAPFCA